VAPDEIATRGVLACLLEAAAPKPGNVSRRRKAADATFGDFLASAAAIGPALAAAARGGDGAGGLAAGAAIRTAVEATRRYVGTNTNLGIVLLVVPLARAAGRVREPESIPVGTLRAALEEVLAGLTVEDAREAYAAIRLAAPGGLGRVEAEAVSGEPPGSLREAMRLAAARDDVAREYALGYPATFDVGLPALLAHAAAGPERAVVQAALTLLAACPDTLIARKAGVEAARAASAEARAVLELGGIRTPAGRRRLAVFDRALRRGGGRLNPGTTADLTAASLFAAYLTRGERPFEAYPDGGAGGEGHARREGGGSP
jgi:triphosphoribosyl-dephospho-CoA synthase